MNTTACKRLFSLGCVAHTDGAVFQAKLEPNKKVTALLGCCLCCCGCCGVALPFWIFFIKIIVAFFDINNFCSG